MQLTPEKIAANAHIPDKEMRYDIRNTKHEIEAFQKKILEAEKEIADRKEFIDFLESLLAHRAQAKENQDAIQNLL